MARQHQQPEIGQKFWKEGIGSGTITYVNYQFKEVYVSFYEKGMRTFEFDELLGSWEEIHGGTWMLYSTE